MKPKMQNSAALLLILLFPCATLANDDVNGSYIDRLKKEMGPAPLKSEAYSETIKKELEAKHPTLKPNQSYIDELRSTDPKTIPIDSDESYTELEKAKLEPQETGGAIQAYREGRSELKLKRVGAIHHAIGVKYGVSLTRAISVKSGAGARDFNDVYGSNYVPDLSAFYEFQPFHSEWYGSIGIMAMGGLSYFHGKGAFATAIKKPGENNPETFPLETDTQFQFFILPLTVGLNYRFNLFRILRPYIMAGPSLFGYVEMRNDYGDTHRGLSKGLFMSAGVSILLDWLSSKSSWDLYQNYGIKHCYLTLDYTRLTTFSGDVNFNSHGAVAGLTFEY